MLRVLPIALCSLWLACMVPATASAWSEQVLRAQQRLDALGLTPGPADGVMGPQTQAAIRAFQRQNALPLTGALDWQTQTALSASVRTSRGDPPAPVPQSVPVPAVAISALPPPGTGPTRAETAAETISGADSSAERPTSASAADPLGNQAAPPPVDITPASAAADGGILRRSAPAIVLGLAAVGTWLGLLLWWLRQRGRRAAADAAAE